MTDARYESPPRRVPKALAKEFRKRCKERGSAAGAFASMIGDWSFNDPISGLGTRHEWWAKHNPGVSEPLKAPPFPFSFYAMERAAAKGRKKKA